MIDSTEIQFDGWRLLTRSGELLRDGTTYRLPQQPLRVLLELLAHPGEVVTRERLVQVLWPKGVVDFDNSLNAVVRKLRVALGDDSGTPRYIETLPRVGYRFIGSIAPAAPGQADAPSATSPSIDTSAATSGAMQSADSIQSPRSIRGFGRSRLRWAIPAIAVVLTGASVAWWYAHQARPLAASSIRRAGDAGARSSSQHAYELYLDGKFQRSRRDINANPLAIESFQAALREDPYFADAWAALSETYTGTGTQQFMPLAQAMEQARSAALRALELNPKLASGHAALGLILMYYDLDYAAAEKQYLEARINDDRYARLWHGYAMLRGFQGRTDEALDYIGRARELEPMTLLYTSTYANLLYYTRRYQDAIEYVQPVLASQPRFDQVRSVLIRALLESGDTKGALDQLPLRYSELPMLSDDGVVFARSGRRDEALRQVERLERHAREGYGVAYEVAIVHAALGQVEPACAALRRALDDRSPTLGWLRLDPRMDPLRKSACYAEMMQRLYR